MNNLLKMEAIKLRKNGLSYGDIKRKLNISKATLSYWLKDVPLTEEQRKKLYTKQVLILSQGPQCQKERRQREINEILKIAKKEVHVPLTLETFRLFGAALYWAEGSKTNGFKITNSDPCLILFIVKWIEKIFNIHPHELKAWLNIYPQQNEIKIKQFWSQLTNIPIEKFGKSFIKPLSKNYKKNNLYYGTISIRIPRGTDIRYKIFGWIRVALKNINDEVEIAQKEWGSLQKISRAINLPKK